MPFLTVALMGCCQSNLYHFCRADYSLNEARSSFHVGKDSIDVVTARLAVSPIDEATYDSRGFLNVVESYLPDENGDSFFSLLLRIGLKDRDPMQIDLLSLNEGLGRRDSYRFDFKHEEGDPTFSFLAVMDITDAWIEISNVHDECLIGGKIVNECRFDLVMSKENQ